MPLLADTKLILILYFANDSAEAVASEAMTATVYLDIGVFAVASVAA